MNKHKRNLDALRQHLGRDAKGLEFLGAVSRDLNEQRKKIAMLEEALEVARDRVAIAKQKEERAYSQAACAHKQLESEKERQAAAERKASRYATELAALQAESSVEDETGEVPSSGVDPAIAHIVNLSKRVRGVFKRIPTSRNQRQEFCLEDFIKEYSGVEFMHLGMMIAMLALHGFPAYVCADRTIRDMKGWEIKHSEKFIHWYGRWIQADPTSDNLFAITWHTPHEEGWRQ